MMLLIVLLMGAFTYKTKQIITTESLINFYRFFVNSDSVKKSIIVDTIIARLKKVPIIDEKFKIDDELPF